MSALVTYFECVAGEVRRLRELDFTVANAVNRRLATDPRVMQAMELVENAARMAMLVVDTVSKEDH